MTDDDLKKVRELCESMGILALFLHGSRATGSSRLDSDFDFAFLAPHGANTSFLENALLPALAEISGCPEAEVDLQDLRQAPPHFRVRVFDTGRLLFVGDTTELARFHASSVSENWDLQHFLRPFRQAMRRRIKEGKFAS